MTLPAVLFGLLVASLYGALFHLLRGGGVGRLLLYLVLAWSGFAAGQWIGTWQNWMLFPVGPIDLGVATLGSAVFLVAGYWLSLVEIGADRGDDAV